MVAAAFFFEFIQKIEFEFIFFPARLLIIFLRSAWVLADPPCPTSGKENPNLTCH